MAIDVHTKYITQISIEHHSNWLALLADHYSLKSNLACLY